MTVRRLELLARMKIMKPTTGEGWGRGSRKRANAVAHVKPGSGKIRVNGKLMTQYFHMETQQWRMIKPLVVSQYTCRADVDVWVHGGGTSGQCEACIPAIGRAIGRLDPSTKNMLRKCKKIVVTED